jgi:hypothetical protein
MSGCQLADDPVEEFRSGATGSGELLFQLVDQRHQLIDLGHDPAFFGERRDGNEKLLQTFRRFDPGHFQQTDHQRVRSYPHCPIGMCAFSGRSRDDEPTAMP